MAFWIPRKKKFRIVVAKREVLEDIDSFLESLLFDSRDHRILEISEIDNPETLEKKLEETKRRINQETEIILFSIIYV